MKATRIKREDGKNNYLITMPDKSEHLCEPVEGSTKWTMDGETYDSVKACKAALSGEVSDGPKPSGGAVKGTWDCTDPCALVILRTPVDDPATIETLDAHGWLVDGEPDYERAKREIERTTSVAKLIEDLI
jgi:hypothetical protein